VLLVLERRIQIEDRDTSNDAPAVEGYEYSTGDPLALLAIRTGPWRPSPIV
jgi:hypothetical protein